MIETIARLRDLATDIEVLYWQHYRSGLPRVARRGCDWSAAENELLRVLYPHYTNPDLALIFGRTASAVKKKALTQLRCEPKRPDVVARAYRQAMQTARKTWFPPGNQPHTWVPVGTVSPDSDGYLRRKYADRPGPARRRWKYVHIELWEEHNGPLPAGHNIVFRNGDKTDIRLENLECISDADLMRRNTRHRYPREINNAIAAKAALTRRINKLERK